jgi:hypothetical protein
MYCKLFFKKCYFNFLLVAIYMAAWCYSPVILAANNTDEGLPESPVPSIHSEPVIYVPLPEPPTSINYELLSHAWDINLPHTRNRECTEFLFPPINRMDSLHPVTAPCSDASFGINLMHRIYQDGMTATLNPLGTLTFEVQTNSGGLRGRELFNNMISVIGHRIERIHGQWTNHRFLGDNFRSYHNGLAAGLSPVEAAANTWTGRMAIRSGYRHVRILNRGEHFVEVEFLWPGRVSFEDMSPPDTCRANTANSFGGYRDEDPDDFSDLLC